MAAPQFYLIWAFRFFERRFVVERVVLCRARGDSGALEIIIRVVLNG